MCVGGGGVLGVRNVTRDGLRYVHVYIWSDLNQGEVGTCSLASCVIYASLHHIALSSTHYRMFSTHVRICVRIYT